MTDRREEIGMRLEAVRAEIATSARAAGRQPEEITLVVVTKTFPASDVEHLAALGVLDAGENREQEGSTKASEVLAQSVGILLGSCSEKKSSPCWSGLL
jgi:PLP dependent protein